jgi:ferredoxin, 2Fe-2S
MPKVVFIEANGNRREIHASSGKTLMEIGRDAGLDIEGACDGAMACSTCHVIVDESWAGKIPPKTDDEQDMLDLALGVGKHSRLGCQIKLTDALDGLVVSLPKQTRNILLG